MDLPRDETDSFRGESDQNILTSLGTLHARVGLDSLRGQNGLQDDIESRFEEAGRCFEEAKYGEFPNAYAYHGQAYMWLQRAQYSEDELHRINQAGIALQILAVAKDNLNPGDMQPLFELETRVWSLLGNKDRVQNLIQMLKDHYNTARGYYIVAEMLRRETSEAPSSDDKTSLLRAALEQIDEGLRHFPADDHCARMRVLLLKELDGDANPSQYYAALKKMERNCTSPERQTSLRTGQNVVYSWLL